MRPGRPRASALRRGPWRTGGYHHSLKQSLAGAPATGVAGRVCKAAPRELAGHPAGARPIRVAHPDAPMRNPGRSPGGAARPLLRARTRPGPRRRLTRDARRVAPVRRRRRLRGAGPVAPAVHNRAARVRLGRVGGCQGEGWGRAQGRRSRRRAPGRRLVAVGRPGVDQAAHALVGGAAGVRVWVLVLQPGRRKPGAADVDVAGPNLRPNGIMGLRRHCVCIKDVAAAAPRTGRTLGPSSPLRRSPCASAPSPAPAPPPSPSAAPPTLARSALRRPTAAAHSARPAPATAASAPGPGPAAAGLAAGESAGARTSGPWLRAVKAPAGRASPRSGSRELGAGLPAGSRSMVSQAGAPGAAAWPAGSPRARELAGRLPAPSAGSRPSLGSGPRPAARGQGRQR